MSSKKTKAENARSIASRVIIWAIAVAFGVSSVGVGVLAVWQATHENQDSATNQGPTLQGTKLTDFTPIAKVDKLETIDLKEGTGQEVKAGDTVVADYTGAFAASGIIFQSSLDSGMPFSAKIAEGSILKGWVDGVPGMKVGGTRRIIIPAEQAYGATGSTDGTIPANSDLVFDVTVHSIGE